MANATASYIKDATTGWVNFHVPAGSTGTVIRSSCNSGPFYKEIERDFNGRPGEVRRIELIHIASNSNQQDLENNDALK